MNVKFELWVKNEQRRRVIVIRDAKGRFQAKRNQKSSGIKSKEDVIRIYSKTQTLYKDRIRVTSKRKSKTLIIDPENVKKFKQISKNTGYIKSKKKIKSQQYYQYMVELNISKSKKMYKGYSDIKGTKSQALNRAFGGARLDSIIPYPYVIEQVNNNEGWIKSPSGHIRIHYTTEFYFQTYIKT